MRRWVNQHWRDPVAWTELVQTLKTVIAAVGAWAIAVYGFDLSQAFLAPWAALLVVHATVYRTFRQGMQQVAGTVVGVTLAWATGNLFGLNPLAIALMLLVALGLGKISALRLDGTEVASIAVIVLAVGESSDQQQLLLRFLETAIGIAVGLLVNLVAWPPLRDLSAARAIQGVYDQVGDLLQDMSGQLHRDSDNQVVQEWTERTRDIDESIDEAWALVRQAGESGRLNPRRGARLVKHPEQFHDLLHRMEQSVADIRSMARTLDHSISEVNEWDQEFRGPWARLLAEAGDAIQDTDAQRLAAVRIELADLARALSDDSLSSRHWPDYGGLILNLRNVVSAMDWVAESNPVAAAVLDGNRPFIRG